MADSNAQQIDGVLQEAYRADAQLGDEEYDCAEDYDVGFDEEYPTDEFPDHVSGIGGRAEVRCYSVDEVGSVLKTLAQRLGMLEACSEDEAVLLLAAFKWQLRRAEEALFGDEASTVRARLGITALGRAGDGGAPPALPDAASPSDAFFDDCAIEEVAYADADACARGHWFGRNTWIRLLTEAARDPKTALTQTRCPNVGVCNELIRPRLFRRFVPELMPRLEAFRARAFAEGSATAPFFRRCPEPACE